MKQYQCPQELKDLTSSWFSDIVDQSDMLTTANVSHRGATIKGIASRSKQYILEFGSDCDTDLRDKLVKYFSTIEELADELTTANVSHKKSYIKGFAGRAKEYLIKHTQDYEYR